MVSNEIFILCLVVWLCLIVFMLLYNDYKKWTREGERKSDYELKKWGFVGTIGKKNLIEYYVEK